MKLEITTNLSDYLDSSRCFNYTGLAEFFISADEPEDEEEYFEQAVTAGSWAKKVYNLNE